MALYLWLVPGRPAPVGYLPAGVASRWQDTGRVRAELWLKADPFDDVRPQGARPPLAEPLGVPAADRLLAATGREFPATEERNP